MSASDIRRFPYEGGSAELRLVWDSCSGVALPTNSATSNGPASPSLSKNPIFPQPMVSPAPLPVGPPTPWPVLAKDVPAQTGGGTNNHSGGAASGSVVGNPVLACVNVKAPMNDKLQKQMSTIEPICEEEEAEASNSKERAAPITPKPADPPAPSTQPESSSKRSWSKPSLSSRGSFSAGLSSLATPFSSGDSPPPPNMLSVRPKNGLRTTSSNFIIRVEISHTSASGFARVMSNAASAQLNASRHPDSITIAFWTQNKTLSWMQLPNDAAPVPATANTAEGQSESDQLDAKAAAPIVLPKSFITFALPITAMAVYEHSASYGGIDVLVACGADILWIDPVAAKYSRFNKTAIITSSHVVRLAWCPPTTENGLPTFLSAHADGSVLHFALDREDPSALGTVQIPKADSKWTPNSDILTWTHPAPQSDSSSTKRQPPRHNPIIAWRCSKKVLTDLSVSPDPNHPGRLLAVASEDGVVRVIDLISQKLLDSYESYFGGINCVNWNSDGSYLLTGGQDDLVSVYSAAEQRLLFRCQGHMSFVRRIAPEPFMENSAKNLRTSLGSSRCGSGTKQRFASVGEDARLVLWDLSGSAHHHRTASRLHQHAVDTGARRASQDQQPFTRHNLSSTLSLNTLQRKHTNDANEHDNSYALEDSISGDYVWHPAPSRRDVPIFKPVASAPIAQDQLVDLAFLPSGCAVLTKNGHLRVFLRPLPPPKTS